MSLHTINADNNTNTIQLTFIPPSINFVLMIKIELFNLLINDGVSVSYAERKKKTMLLNVKQFLNLPSNHPKNLVHSFMS